MSNKLIYTEVPGLLFALLYKTNATISLRSEAPQMAWIVKTCPLFLSQAFSPPLNI